MSAKDVSVWDQSLFDASDVTWEIKETRRRDKISIELTTEGTFNLVKIYLSLKMICEKVEAELNIMDESEGEH